jgi:hypothetical protein
MALKGGVIIIGSLLWDTDPDREKWREVNLCSESRFQVYLPIRYGRCSRTRKNTYTMVFSNRCYSNRYGLGTGWILPIRSEINSFENLKAEAQKMGEAEGLGEVLFKSWGSIALLVNPNKEIDNSIIMKWGEHMVGGLSNHNLFTEKLMSEKACIDGNGLLQIRWPKEASPQNRIEKLDLLIATAVVPTLIKGRYPTAYKIAGAMENSEYYDYFQNNVKNNITTFQDERIIERIKKQSRK